MAWRAEGYDARALLAADPHLNPAPNGHDSQSNRWFDLSIGHRRAFLFWAINYRTQATIGVDLSFDLIWVIIKHALKDKFTALPLCAYYDPRCFGGDLDPPLLEKFHWLPPKFAFMLHADGRPIAESRNPKSLRCSP